MSASPRYRLVAHLASLVALALIPLPARAVTNVWGGGGGNANWTTAANWTNATGPGASDTVMFLSSNYASGLTTTLGSNWTVNALILNTTNMVAIGGNTLTLQSGKLSRGTLSRTNQTINSAITLGADGLFSVEGAANYNTNLLINGSIGESGGPRSLTVAGTRIAHLMGSNTFTGSLLITNTAGVVVGGTNAASSVTVGSAVGAGGTLLVGGDYALGNGTLFLNTNAIISGYGATRMIGNAVTANGNFTVGPSTTANTSGGMGLTFTNTLTLNADLAISNATSSGAETVFFAGGIGDAGAGRSFTINASGVNRRTMLTNSTYTGATIVNNGYLLMSGTNATSAVTVNPGATLTFLTDNPFAAGVLITASNATLVSSNAHLIANGVSFTGATNTYSGNSLTINGNSTIVSNMVLMVSGATAADILTFGGSVGENTPSSTLIIGSTSRKVVFATNNTYTGATIVNSISGAEFDGSNSTAFVTVNPGAKIVIGNDNALGTGIFYANATSGTISLGWTNSPVLANAVQMQGTNLLVGPGNAYTHITFNGPITMTSNVVLSIDGNGTPANSDPAAPVFGGGFTDNGSNFSLTLAGSANNRRLIISNSSSYGGGTYILNGLLKLGNANALPTSGALTVNSIAGLNDGFFMNGFSQTLGSLSGTGTVQIGTGTLTVGDATSTSYGGLLTGTGNLVKQGAGVLTLNGSSNTFSGATTVKGGTLILGNGNALANSTLNYANGVVFGGGITSFTLGALAGSTDLAMTNSSGAAFSLSAGNNGTDSVYSGTLSMGGNLTKAGAGIMTLTAANTYTGATTVAGGILRANDGVGLSPSNTLILAGGALETSTDFTRGLGSGASKVQLSDLAGFSARGGPVIVSIGGLGTPTALTWGAANFNPTNLVLNAASADSALTFANSIDFGNGLRTNTVAASTATMTGLVTNGGLVKAGAGTLTLANAGLTNFAFGSGNAGTIRLTGGQLLAPSLNIGGAATDTATLIVEGSAAAVLLTNANANLNIQGNNSQLQVLDGGRLTVNLGGGNIQVGAAGTSSAILVSGTNSRAIFNAGFSYIGQNAQAQMVVSNTGQAWFNNLIQLGYGGGPSSLLVSDSGSVLSNSAGLYIGSRTNNATMVVSNGGRVFTGGGNIGNQNALLSRSNLVVVTGSGSLWVDTGDLNVGENGWYNEIRILSGGVVSNANGNIGHANAGVLGNSAIVSGGTWVNNNGFNMIGGDGRLVVSDAGRLQSASATLGNAGAASSYSSNLTVSVSGSGSVWSNLGVFYLGNYSTFNNLVLVTNGGRLVSLGAINVGNGNSNLNNRLVVSDAGSLVDNGANILLVGAGTVGAGNQVIVTNGATLKAGGMNVGVGVSSSNNLLLVSGRGSVVQLMAGLSVGTNGTTGGTIPRGVGFAIINDGATLEAQSLAGGINSGTISNMGGVFRFVTNTPVITPNTAGSIVMNDGVISFRGVTNAAINGQITNISYAGANTLQLDNATNAALAYAFTNGGSFTTLELVNGKPMWQGSALLVGNGGTLRASNAQATVGAVLTNAGMVSVINAQLTYLSNVVLNGGSFVTQNGTNTFTGGFAMAAGASLTLTTGTSRVDGAISNAAGTTINAVNANVTFGGPVVISGHYYSDPSTNTFLTNVVVTQSGSLYGSNGDLFVFQKDFFMQSTNRSEFSLWQSAVLFTNSVTHLMSVSNSSSQNVGAGFTNFSDLATNFAIGQLSIAPDDRLTLAGNKDATRTNALYVGWLDIERSMNTNDYTSVTNALAQALNLPNINLYYDKYDPRNDWLNANLINDSAAGYQLWGPTGGLLLPIPEPSAFLALAGGLAILILRRRKA